MEAASASAHNPLVTVVLTIDEEDGTTRNENKSIPSGPTKVPDLKTELGVAEVDELWVIEASGKRKQLADHETHDVKEGDHYEDIVKGGVS
jgi:hypothetical protein